MDSIEREVSSPKDLLVAAGDEGVRRIIVAAHLSDLPTLRLSPGQTLQSRDLRMSLRFAPGQDGLQLTTDNQVENLELRADPPRRAIFNDTTVERFGRIVLRNLSVEGIVELVARDRMRGGHVEIHDLDIVAADARSYEQRPKGYGVEVIPGALTLWNQSSDPAVIVTADLTGLNAGRAGAPVRGSGIFVSGAGETGGKLMIRRLETGPVHSDGGIAAGTPDTITGGVFVVSGAFIDSVRNRGPVTTYGANDMVLDN